VTLLTVLQGARKSSPVAINFDAPDALAGWSIFEGTPGAEIFANDGTLRIVGSGAYPRLMSPPVDLTESYFYAQLVRLGGWETSYTTNMMLLNSANQNESYEFAVQGNYDNPIAIAGIRYDGGRTEQARWYLGSDRYLRMRESGGTMYWETSPDAVNWTIQTTRGEHFSPSSALLYFEAGEWQGNGSRGATTVWDNINTPVLTLPVSGIDAAPPVVDAPPFAGLSGYPPAATLTDTFSGSAVDLAKWSIISDPADITVANGTLNIVANGNYSGIEAVGPYRLQSTSFAVKIASNNIGTWDTLGINFGAEQYDNPDNRYMLGISGGDVPKKKAFIKVGGNESSPYSPNENYVYPQDQWVRLREAFGTLYFETSTDFVNWTVLHSRSVDFDVGKMRLFLRVGEWYGGPTRGYVQSFDAINTNLSSSSLTASDITGAAPVASSPALSTPVMKASKRVLTFDSPPSTIDWNYDPTYVSFPSGRLAMQAGSAYPAFYPTTQSDLTGSSFAVEFADMSGVAAMPYGGAWISAQIDWQTTRYDLSVFPGNVLNCSGKENSGTL
jgi:hypothetical protein